VSPNPSSDRFIDPNERLLASTVPPPPPSRGERIRQALGQLRWRDLQRIPAWFHSREGHSCVLAALAGAALMLGFYRSEAASAASTALAALQRTEVRSTPPVVERASVLPEPRALAAREPVSPLPPITRVADLADVEPPVTSGEQPLTSGERPVTSGGVDRAKSGTPAVRESRSARVSPRRAAKMKKSHGKRVAKKKFVKKKRKAKQAIARAPRRTKTQRAKRSGAAAWLEEEVRGKGAVASKQR
jgi:hypothetical protein